MSGIAGFFNPKRNFTEEREKWEQILNHMNRVQKHRGPDGEGIFLETGCGLSHVRLSVIDLKRGRQPLLLKREGKTFAIVYDGELYNMQELKQELMNKGVCFETAGDTEVVLAGYMEEGPEFVNKMNGVFAFAVWDPAQEKVFLFRDRLGVKPLFYTWAEDTLVFSSEIKGLFAYPGCSPVLDRGGLREIFALGPAKSYGKGVFKGVYEVYAGHFLVCGAFGVSDCCYWKLVSQPHEDSYKETVEKTSYLIRDAVKKQMVSDVPISTFLSGGVDSSLVTAICAKELLKQGKELNTFSFDFKDNALHFKSNSFQPSLDRPWVDRMVEYAKTNHIYLECDNRELIDYLFRAVDARDLPCMADVESSLLYFCQKVADYSKVALTGECADEIFGGYPWFHKKECFDAHAFPWSMDMEPRKLLLSNEVSEELKLEEYAAAVYEKSIAETPALDGENKEEKRRREIAYLNLKWFMVTLLDRMDRASMASGLGARVPLADYRIVEYVWNVPWDMKCPNGIVKGLLRAAGENDLPKDVLYRKKSPYPKTYNPEYERLLGERLLEEAGPNAPICQFLDKKKLERFLKSPSDYGKPWYGQLMAGPQLIAFWLQINYWLEKYQIKIEN